MLTGEDFEPQTERRADNQNMEERELIRRWVHGWQEAGPHLERIRRQEIRDADNLKTLAILEQAFNHALRTLPPRPSSGMVEMQRGFAKLRR